MANTELLRCDTDFDEEKIAKIASSLSLKPGFLLSSSKKLCLNKTANLITASGLTNGYQITLDDVKGILFMWPMITTIIKNVPSSMDVRSCLNLFYDLSDNAGYHVEMYAEDSLEDNYLSHFNDKLPDYFTHKIEQDELRLLYYFYVFGSSYLDWLEYE